MLLDIDSPSQAFSNKRGSSTKFLNCHSLISRNFCYILATWEPISAQILTRPLCAKYRSRVESKLHETAYNCIREFLIILIILSFRRTGTGSRMIPLSWLSNVPQARSFKCPFSRKCETIYSATVESERSER